MSEEAPESPQNAIENYFWVILHRFLMKFGQATYVAGGFLLLLVAVKIKKKNNKRIAMRMRFASHDEGTGLGFEPAWRRW